MVRWKCRHSQVLFNNCLSTPASCISPDIPTTRSCCSHTAAVVSLLRRSSGRHQVARGQVPITLLQLLQRWSVHSWLHTRTPWNGKTTRMSVTIHVSSTATIIPFNWSTKLSPLLLLVYPTLLRSATTWVNLVKIIWCAYKLRRIGRRGCGNILVLMMVVSALSSHTSLGTKWGGCVSPMIAIFDLANSMRIGPRSEDNR